MNNSQYLIQRRNRMRQRLRIRLGVLQMVHKPLLNIFLIPILILAVVIWKEKHIMLGLFDVPQILYPLFEYSIFFLVVIIPILLVLCMVEVIGNITAQKDEGDIEEAFDVHDLRYGCPILMNKKCNKGSNVTMREYYSSIPLKRWVEKMDDISDSMSVHFVEKIKYGKSNGKRIVIYTAPGREVASRGNLYDEEF